MVRRWHIRTLPAPRSGVMQRFRVRREFAATFPLVSKRSLKGIQVSPARTSPDPSSPARAPQRSVLRLAAREREPPTPRAARGRSTVAWRRPRRSRTACPDRRRRERQRRHVADDPRCARTRRQHHLGAQGPARRRRPGRVRRRPILRTLALGTRADGDTRRHERLTRASACAAVTNA